LSGLKGPALSSHATKEACESDSQLFAEHE
jgi:hypothetical protein